MGRGRGGGTTVKRLETAFGPCLFECVFFCVLWYTEIETGTPPVISLVRIGLMPLSAISRLLRLASVASSKLLSDGLTLREGGLSLERSHLPWQPNFTSVI